MALVREPTRKQATSKPCDPKYDIFKIYLKIVKLKAPIPAISGEIGISGHMLGVYNEEYEPQKYAAPYRAM